MKLNFIGGVIAVLAFAVRFSEQEEKTAQEEIAARTAASLAPVPVMGD